MSFQLLTEDDLESIGVISGQNSIYFDSRNGFLDSKIGYNFVEEVINPEKTQFIIKYENSAKQIPIIYAIMEKETISSSNLEYEENSLLYKAYKIYKKV